MVGGWYRLIHAGDWLHIRARRTWCLWFSPSHTHTMHDIHTRIHTHFFLHRHTNTHKHTCTHKRISCTNGQYIRTHTHEHSVHVLIDMHTDTLVTLCINNVLFRNTLTNISTHAPTNTSHSPTHHTDAYTLMHTSRTCSCRMHIDTLIT